MFRKEEVRLLLTSVSMMLLSHDKIIDISNLLLNFRLIFFQSVFKSIDVQIIIFTLRCSASHVDYF